MVRWSSLRHKTLRNWNENGELLMFLKRVGNETNRFRPYSGGAGLFQIEDGQRMRSLLYHAESDKELGQSTLDEVIQRVKAHRSVKGER
jgi:hypothetical protein